MRNVLLDDEVRDRQLRIAAATAALALACTAALTVQGLVDGGLRAVVVALLAIVVFGGAGALALLRQQHALGRPVAAAPLATARWTGALVAAVGGPLVTAVLLLAVVGMVGAVVAPESGRGSLAGVGVAWLVLPMALLVTGTASLRTVAVAAERRLDVSELIARAEGHEWSLVPIGLGLALAVLLMGVGVAAVAVGHAAGAVPMIGGAALLFALSGRLVGRYEALIPA